MKIAIGCDHRGFSLKEELKSYISKLGLEVKDFGTFDDNHVTILTLLLK